MYNKPTYFSNVLSTDHNTKYKLFSSRLRPFPDLEKDVYFDSEEHTTTLTHLNKLFVGTRSGLFSVLDTTSDQYTLMKRLILSPTGKIRDIVCDRDKVYVCQEGILHKIDMNRLEPESVSKKPSCTIKSIDVYNSLIITAESTGKISIFPQSQFPRSRLFIESEHDLTCAKFIDQRSIVAADIDGYVSVYDIRNLHKPLVKEKFSTGEFDINDSSLKKRFVCTWLTVSPDRSRIAALAHGDFVSIIESSQLQNLRTPVNFAPKQSLSYMTSMYSVPTSTFDIRANFSPCGEWLAIGSQYSQFSLLNTFSENILNVNIKIGKALLPSFVDSTNIAVSAVTGTGSFIRKRGLRLQEVDGVSFYQPISVLYKSTNF